MDPPSDPIAAATHPDPYLYFAGLVERRPLYRDDVLNLWVAASAEVVAAVLGSDICLVRPPMDPVPRHLLGSRVATIYQHLIRMNDGSRHGSAKRAVTKTLAALNRNQAGGIGDRCAQTLAVDLGVGAASGSLTDFAFSLPAYVVASLLGVPDDHLGSVAS